MARLVLSSNFDLANLPFAQFLGASPSLAASAVRYKVGTRELVLTGTFTLADGEVSTGRISKISYLSGGKTVFGIERLSMSFADFEEALHNDDLGAIFAGADEIKGASIASVLRGYDGSDKIVGGKGHDTLMGGQGNDTLDGGAGNDLLIGGSGDDVYRVSQAGDKVVEGARGGIDRVETTLSKYTLTANVENLMYVGTDKITATGNKLNNLMIGGAKADKLIGGAGADTLRGGNGNDTLEGGAGNDHLIGDAGGTEVVVVATGASPSDPTRALSISSGLPEISTTTTTSVSGYISNSQAGAGVFNLAFVLDVSGSMASRFSGADVGDVNGDGASNTQLDAAIAAFRQLVQTIEKAGFGDKVRIGLIPFESASHIAAVGTASSDLNGNGVADVIDAAVNLDDLGGTAYDRGLQKAVEFFNGAPSGSNQVFFISDGAPDWGNNYGSLLAQLGDPKGINATIRALGINASGSYYDVLDLLDDGVLNQSAINVGNPADLTAGLLSSQVEIGDVRHVEVWLNGTLVKTLLPKDLEDTPFGLRYSVSIPGLKTSGANVVETRMVLNDAAGTVLSNGQTISVGTLVSNDSLIGGAGNDTLDGGAGKDTLVGGSGDDVYVVDSTGDSIVEKAKEGRDRVESTVTYTLDRAMTKNVEDLTLMGSSNINATGNALANRLRGNAGDNDLSGRGGNDTIDGGAGNDTVSYSYSSVAVSVDLDKGLAVSTRETDTLLNIENVIGSQYSDYLVGDDGDNILAGRGGNDTLYGGYGFDTADYSTATSAMRIEVSSYGGSASSANGAEGLDSLYSIEGVIGSKHNDVIFDDSWSSSGFANRFEGGAGNDSLYGGSGADTLIGGAGNDLLDGGDGSYIDVADYSDAGAAVSGRINGTIKGSKTGTDTLRGIERVIGSAFADKLTGSNGNDWLTGGAGNDTLDGGAGNDTIEGGLGKDSLIGGAGDDLFIITSAQSKVVELGSSGDDTVQSALSYTLTNHVENLVLSGSADITGKGNGLDNKLTGNSGANKLTGLAGNDLILGGAGDDTLVGGTGNDSLQGGDGFDWADFSDLKGAVSGTLSSYSSTYGLFTSGNETDYLVLIEGVIGTSKGDKVFGSSDDNILRGEGGNDTLSGEYGNDTLYGGAGNDSLSGGSGEDWLYGGLGNDTIDGGYGYDMLSYENSATAVNVDLSTGTATGEGNDVFTNIEYFRGSAKNDVISWKAAHPTSSYYATDYWLDGREGNDSLVGSAGSDTLIGGLGRDTMDAGTVGSNDVFLFESVEDSKVGAADLIRNFVSGNDKIDLTRIDADLGMEGDQAFAFVGTTAFSGQAGELRFVQTRTGLMLSGDVDGDKKADFAIEFAGLSSIVVEDFLL